MRRHEWPELLAEYVRSRRATPFAWGTHDCCRFAAGAVEAITGTDPMQDFVYESEDVARALIAQAGSLEALVTQVLGPPLPSVAQAQRGDVVLADVPTPAVGVCLGTAAAFASHKGVVMLRMSRARAAWRIG